MQTIKKKTKWPYEGYAIQEHWFQNQFALYNWTHHTPGLTPLFCVKSKFKPIPYGTVTKSKIGHPQLSGFLYIWKTLPIIVFLKKKRKEKEIWYVLLGTITTHLFPKWEGMYDQVL